MLGLWVGPAYRACTLVFGRVGTFEQDGLENWTELTRDLRSTVARELYLPYE